MKRFKKLFTVIALFAAAAVAAAPAVSAHPARSKNVVQVAEQSGQFKTLVTLIKDAGLAGTLESKGPFTVFAPTDAAFSEVPKSTLKALARNRVKLRAVLLYHVLPGDYRAARLVKLHSVRTVEGQSLAIHVRHGVVKVNAATVIAVNIPASNGVIHVINHVLIPKA